MQPPKRNVVLVIALALGFLAFAHYIVRLNQDIQGQIEPEEKQR